MAGDDYEQLRRLADRDDLPLSVMIRRVLKAFVERRSAAKTETSAGVEDGKPRALPRRADERARRV
jgi:predicted transcriptional regulator